MIQDILTLSQVSQSSRTSFGQVDLNAAVGLARQNLTRLRLRPTRCMSGG